MNIGAHKSKVTFFFFEAKLRGINPKGLKEIMEMLAIMGPYVSEE
jgi:hypothetical protein